MIGRLDVVKKGTCTTCAGKGTDPKKRKRKCPTCGGHGKQYICSTCDNEMPCPGTEPVFDQTYCSKRDTSKDEMVILKVKFDKDK
jgi:DnaJ-class molecular chaperone